MINQVNFIRV